MFLQRTNLQICYRRNVHDIIPITNISGEFDKKYGRQIATHVGLPKTFLHNDRMYPLHEIDPSNLLLVLGNRVSVVNRLPGSYHK